MEKDMNYIVIIDDDTRNIFALAATLKSKGFGYISCTGAREAIDLLQVRRDVGMVLIDMMMPDMDGYEAIPLIRKIPGREKLPIIAVTAQAMLGDREKCLAAGADDYISKPIDVDRLMEVVESHLK
jgi:CheY-like chemotaxis protein